MLLIRGLILSTFQDIEKKVTVQKSIQYGLYSSPTDYNNFLFGSISSEPVPKRNQFND